MQPLGRREFLRIAGLAAAGGVLAACQPVGVQPVPAAPAAGEAEKPAAPEKAGYTGKFVILSCGPIEREVDMIKEIEEKHAGVKIDWRNLTSEKYTELFSAAEVAGDQIDILDMNGQDLRRYAVAERLLDLSDLTYLDRFRPVGISTYTLKGKLWAVPRGGIGGWVLFYNKKAFEAIGVTEEISTYAQLKEMAPELKKAGYEPISHEGKVLYMWPVWHFILHAQTSKNQSIENTAKTLAGEMKFTDPEYVEALAWLNRYARDEMFNEGVLSTDRDGALLALKQGRVAMYHNWMGIIRDYRENPYPALDLSVMSPLQVVEGTKRECPGGTGRALSIYRKIAPERLSLAYDIQDIMTTDKWVAYMNKLSNDSVSCNVNIQPSDDPLALKYADECAPLQIVYEDWIWPPEITRSFQENQQAIVAGVKTPEEATQANQKVLEQLYADGYEFVN